MKPPRRPRRAPGVELLDSGMYVDGELRGTLADLRLYNARFGGTRIMVREVARMLEAAGRPRRVTLLDVATGSGDIPASLTRWARARGIEVAGVALDSNGAILEEARRYHSETVHGGNGHPAERPALLVQADACRLPHPDRSVDIAICSTFLHHLTRDEVVMALGEMRRVARLGVIAVDLTRSRLALSLVWLLTRVTSSNRLTRHDGLLSIRRAFTPAEMGELMREAGMGDGKVLRIGPVRMVARWAPGQGGAGAA